MSTLWSNKDLPLIIYTQELNKNLEKGTIENYKKNMQFKRHNTIHAKTFFQPWGLNWGAFNIRLTNLYLQAPE